MDEKTFPFRLDKQTLSLISSLVNTLNQHGARLQSLVQGRCSVLFDKRYSTPDANISFMADSIVIEYPLKVVAKNNEEAANWLNQYHAFISKRKNDTMTPVAERCYITVKANYSGTIDYFLTYMVHHPDGSIAQDTPQGKLFATSALSLAGDARPASSQPDASQPAGHW